MESIKSIEEELAALMSWQCPVLVFYKTRAIMAPCYESSICTQLRCKALCALKEESTQATLIFSGTAALQRRNSKYSLSVSQCQEPGMDSPLQRLAVGCKFRNPPIMLWAPTRHHVSDVVPSFLPSGTEVQGRQMHLPCLKPLMSSV